MGMTSKERMVEAMWNRKPDMVPVAPDISNMIPCRLTGKPFWEIYLNQDPPLWKAYVEAVKFFKMDGWFLYGNTDDNRASKVRTEVKVIEKTPEMWIAKKTHHTPDGDVTETWAYPKGDSESCIKKAVEDFDRDWPCIKHFYPDEFDTTFETWKEMKEVAGDTCAMGLGVDTPMLPYQWLTGQLEEAIMLYYEKPEVMEEYRRTVHTHFVNKAKLLLEQKPDFMMIHASGSITMQSPEIVLHMQMPTFAEVSRLCREAGIPSLVHSCGKERILVDMLGEQTDVNVVNPLEEPPMGDCYLDEVKKAWCHKLAMMGNLNTPELMLKGTVEDIEKASRKAIDDAGADGGFILSTGDQCGRDTPYENIEAMVRVARTYGKY
jgi:uroporphyrinogen decarboxylase